MKIKKSDAIICLAAGFSQMEIIKKAQSLKLKVVAVDKDKNAICSNMVEEFICESTYDSEAIIKRLKKLNHLYNWKGILNRSAGPPVLTASKISSFLNLAGVPEKTAHSFINKDILKNKCLKYDIPTPRFQILENFDDLNQDLIKFPIVIKPSLSLIGKSGITILKDLRDIKIAFCNAMDNSIRKKVLVEEYLPGPDFTLVSFISKAKLKPIIALDELNKETFQGKIFSYGYKTHEESSKNDFKTQAIEISIKIMKLFKISNSPFMSCFRADENGNLKLIEIHLDLGGDLLIEQLFPKALNYDYSKAAVMEAIGEGNSSYDQKVNATAIFYDAGTKLLNRRGFKLVQARNNNTLLKKIKEIEK